MKRRGRPPVYEQTYKGKRLFVWYPNRRIYSTHSRSYVLTDELLVLKRGTFVVCNSSDGAIITSWVVRMAKHNVDERVLRREASRLGVDGYAVIERKKPKTVT